VSRQLRSVGDRAVLVDCPGEDPAALAAGVLAAALGGVVDVVPAAATVLVTVDRPERLPALTGPLQRIPPGAVVPAGEVVVLPVVYDGPDLATVADATGLAVEEVVGRHCAATYRVAFCGFAPGFAYLSGLDPRLELPRRREPRTRVPAGALAVAGSYTAVYPQATPGGWHLLGTCRSALWDPAAERPSPLAPGTVVRFEPR
jgi:KipI family sensor histidine kinase inhibitor